MSHNCHNESFFFFECHQAAVKIAATDIDYQMLCRIKQTLSAIFKIDSLNKI